MKKLFGSAALAAMFSIALAGSAGAVVVVGSLAGAPDPGPLAGETKVITFDAPQAGVTITGDYGIFQGSQSGLAAAPAGDTTKYLVTPFGDRSGSVKLDFSAFLGNQDVDHFSFYWGSIDRYNTIQLLDRSGNSFYTLSGPSMPSPSGSWTDAQANQRVTFNLTGADQDLGGILFTSTSPAFETDTFSFATVPEMGTWGLMIMGFSAMGAMMRNRRRSPGLLA